jgi:hypothetical protein
MQKLVKILVVEHDLRKVATMAAALDPEIRKLPVKIELVAATNLSMALVLLATSDAAITNSALCEGHDAPVGTASGRSVVTWCLQQQKPVVMLTPPIPEGIPELNSDAAWLRRIGLEPIDHSNPWPTALYLLLYTMVAAETEECQITRRGIISSRNMAHTAIHPGLVTPFTTKRTKEIFWNPSPTFYKMVQLGFQPLWTD